MKGNPNLIHPEIGALYEHDFSIPKATLEGILALPRPSLIKDLEEVLDEATRNFKDYDGFYEEAPEESLFLAPAHAIFLLGELEAIEALPALNQFLRQEYESLDFWLGDLLTEEVWVAFYKLAKSDITKLFLFIREIPKEEFANSPHITAISAYFINNPEEQIILLPQYQALLRELTEKASQSREWTKEKQNLTSLVWDLIDCRVKALLPEIEIAIKGNLVAEYRAVDWKETESLLQTAPLRFYEPISIFQQYSKINEWYARIEKDEIDSYNFPKNDYFTKRLADKKDPRLAPKTVYNDFTPFKKTSPDVGRNEPCPCGSGKKYKKCCLRK